MPVDEITKEKAEAQAAAGYANYICHFDADGKLTRVIKMLRGEVSFDLVYTYCPKGKLKTSMETRNGQAIVQEYDEHSRGQRGKMALSSAKICNRSTACARQTERRIRRMSRRANTLLCAGRSETLARMPTAHTGRRRSFPAMLSLARERHVSARRRS